MSLSYLTADYRKENLTIRSLDGNFDQDVNISRDLTVANNTTVNGDLTVANNTTVNGNLTVTGAIVHGGNNEFFQFQTDDNVNTAVTALTAADFVQPIFNTAIIDTSPTDPTDGVFTITPTEVTPGVTATYTVTYTGADTKNFYISYTLSCQLSAGAQNPVIDVFLNVNDGAASIRRLRIRETIVAGGRITGGAGGIFKLKQNDILFLEINTSVDTGDQDFIVDNFSFSGFAI